MCIRDREDRVLEGEVKREIGHADGEHGERGAPLAHEQHDGCLLYTSDAADERSSVDLGGRRIIKKQRAARVRKD